MIKYNKEQKDIIFDTLRTIINTVELEYKDFSYDMGIRSSAITLVDTVYELNYFHSILDDIEIENVFSIENVFELMNRYEGQLFRILSKSEGFDKSLDKCSLKYKKWFFRMTNFLNETLMTIENHYKRIYKGVNQFSALELKSTAFKFYKDGIYNELDEININFFKHFYHIKDKNGNVQYFLKNNKINNQITDSESIIYYFENYTNLIENISPYLFQIAYLDKFNKLDQRLLKELNCNEQIEVTTMAYGV